MAEQGAKTAAGAPLTEVYRVSISAVCTDAFTAGALLGAVLKAMSDKVIDVQQHVVRDTAHPAVSAK